jgi:cell division protein FtsB
MKREISLTTETANDKKKSRRLVDKISRNEYGYVFPDLEMKYL